MIDSASKPRSWRGFDIMVVAPTPTHPQDHGNRKRIYEICAALKRGGARIHYVHYPAEQEWRKAWPVRHENAMREAWDSYQLVAPGRPLHAGPIGLDHEIDEWADPGLEQFIAWACRVRVYDMVIVNYTWMSFCLKAVPPGIFKLLDAHDVFGGRRELFESNGLAAEFFHTTQPEEALGLARADLVWAIKRPEQVYFERALGLANCLTMLHDEPERGWWTRPPSTDGWLRAGVIGARNNVNRRNLEEFLEAALPVFRRYMAPVKIVIAGGCCDDFEGLDHPNVEVLGRVESVDDFYRDIDVVVAPVRFSTGLKIKVSEALASGAPLIAHAHAMEGFPGREPLHRLANFEDMALELAKLSFDRAPLLKLAARSHAVSAEIRGSVAAALEKTRGQLAARFAGTLCMIVPMQAFDPASLLNEHLSAALDYLRFTAGIHIFVTGAPARGAKLDLLERYELGGRLFADPELIARLGGRPPERFFEIPLKELFEVRGYERLYVMTDCRELVRAAGAGLRQIFVRHDAIEIAGGDADAAVEAFRRIAETIVIGAAPSRILRWRGEAGIARLVHAPFRRSGTFECLAHRRRGAGKPPGLLALARAGDPVAADLQGLARKLGLAGSTLDPFDREAADRFVGTNGSPGDDPLGHFKDLRLIVDLTPANALAAILGEAALRQGIPRLVLQRGAVAVSLHGAAPRLCATSLSQLFDLTAQCALETKGLDRLRAEAQAENETLHANDAGWTVLWRMLSAPRSDAAGPAGNAAASLWG